MLSKRKAIYTKAPAALSKSPVLKICSNIAAAELPLRMQYCSRGFVTRAMHVP